MNIKEEIYKKQSGAQARIILDIALKDETALNELMNCFFSENLRLCQTASWSVGMIAEKQEELLLPYFKKMLDNIEEPMHNAILRNTLRAWQFMDIPIEFEGEVFEKVFTYISSPIYPIGVRVFAMTIALNIAKKYSELLDELELQLQQCLLEESKGVLSRTNQVLKSIKGIKNKKQ